MLSLSLEDLLKSNAHVGLSNRVWHPHMDVYVYARRNKTHIIDLVQTLDNLEAACEHVQKVSQEGKSILFVGTSPQASELVAKYAQRCGANYVQHRWLGGLITNWGTAQERIKTLSSLDEKIKSPELASLPRKEVRVLRREHYKLNRNLGGVRDMTQLPAVAIVVDPVRENTAVQELRKRKIPIISISDTDADPWLSKYPIVVNIAAKTPTSLILSELSNSILNAS